MLDKSTHIFSNHLLQLHDYQALPKSGEELIWPSLLLFFSLTLLAFVKFVSFDKVIRILHSTFNKQVLQQLEREEFSPYKFYSLSLNFFFILNISFVGYKLNHMYKWILVDSGSFLQFAFLVLVISTGYFIKSIINALIGLFTGELKLISDYVTRTSLINQAFGLFLFPLVVMLEFSPFDPMIFIILSLLVLAVSFLLKWYRGFIKGLVDERIGLLQIFTYFCGLEILPVLVMVKFVIETF